MFICDDCLEKRFTNGQSMSRSIGKCEICEETKRCNDIPSKFLKSKKENTVEESPIIKIHKLTDHWWLNLFEVDYVCKDGTQATWFMASRHNDPLCVTNRHEADVVVIAAYHTDLKKIVVTKEFRVPLGGYEYGFPAGLVDEGETPAEAAIRELKEETGLTVTRVIKGSPVIYSSPGMTDEAVIMVYVLCEGEISNKGHEAHEDIETMLLSQDEVQELLRHSTLYFGAKAWFVLDFFARTGEI